MDRAEVMTQFYFNLLRKIPAYETELQEIINFIVSADEKAQKIKILLKVINDKIKKNRLILSKDIYEYNNVGMSLRDIACDIGDLERRVKKLKLNDNIEGKLRVLSSKILHDTD